MSINITVKENDYPKLFEFGKNKQKEKLEEVIKTGYQILYPNLEINPENSLILNKLVNLERNSPNLDELNLTLSKLLGISNNSSLKGELGEEMIENLIKTRYPLGNYLVTRSIPHSGDAILEINQNKIMIEVKNYQITVPNKEVEKMKYDMKYQKINYGLMISISSKILDSNNLDLETFVINQEMYYLIKINHLSSETSRLETGLSLLEKLILLNQREKNQEKLIIQDTFHKNLTNFIKKFNENYDLREEYLTMENSIKNALSGFYQKIRNSHLEQEILLKQMTDNLTNNLNQEIINVISIPEIYHQEFGDYKIFPKLIKILEFLTKNRLNFNLDKSKIKVKNEKIEMEIKITKEKLTITLEEMSLTISPHKDENKVIKLIENFLSEE
jgi:hypothetical protein